MLNGALNVSLSRVDEDFPDPLRKGMSDKHRKCVPDLAHRLAPASLELVVGGEPLDARGLAHRHELAPHHGAFRMQSVRERGDLTKESPGGL